jgi:hypothetical protein
MRSLGLFAFTKAKLLRCRRRKIEAHADFTAVVYCNATSGIEIDITVLCELARYNSLYQVFIWKQRYDVARRSVMTGEKVNVRKRMIAIV